MYQSGLSAIQLGTGTNSTKAKLQVFDKVVVDKDGNIPADRLRAALTELGLL